MGKTSREKGKDFERQVANKLKSYGFEDAHRTAQYRGDTGQAPDVEGLPGIHIECKACETPQAFKWINQATRDAANNEQIPVVIWKQSYRPWVAIMTVKDFLLFRKFRRITQTDVIFRKHEGMNTHIIKWLNEARNDAQAAGKYETTGVLFERETGERLVMFFFDDFMRLYLMRERKNEF